MFPARWFTPSYWARRYWAKRGSALAPPAIAVIEMIGATYTPRISGDGTFVTQIAADGTYAPVISGTGALE